jgi:hypothetical protein
LAGTGQQRAYFDSLNGRREPIFHQTDDRAE